MTAGIESVPFQDKATAQERYKTLAGKTSVPLGEHISIALTETGDPDSALLRLERYLESSRGAQTDLDFIAGVPSYARMLLSLLGQSHYLTDILCRNPEYMSWVWQEAELARARTRDEFLDELRQQALAFDTFEGRSQSVRRFKRREFLRIAAREVYAHSPLASVTEDLSNLADACLEMAIEICAADLDSKYGSPRAEEDDSPARVPFTILAMGKLGGRELNFSSDIDLLFLYGDEGKTAGGTSGSVTNGEYFHKLGERIIKCLSDITSEGRVFLVDMRLRPYGRVGPLAVSIDNAIGYYESAGAAWERMALVKARPAAGDRALGREFIDRTRPFVFPRYFDDETLEDIRAVKQQTESHTRQRGETDIEVKLGRGGIRDIEFTIQGLQLLNGGRLPDLRTPNTVEAIHALALHGLLPQFEATSLSSNYTFLRRIEHRLQIEGSQQRHALPGDPEDLDVFARRLGYQSGESLMNEYRDRTNETRQILEQFLATEGGGFRWLNDLLHPMSDGSTGRRRLELMGFSDAAKAQEELVNLYAGPKDRPHSLRVRQQFMAVAPILLEALSGCGNPDMGLLRLGRILDNLRAPGALYDILKDAPHLCQYLVRLVVNSEFLTDILVRDPGLFDTIGTDSALDRPSTREGLEVAYDALTEAQDRDAALYRLRAGELLRIGMRDLCHGVDITQIGRELTLLAEVCLEKAVALARSRVTERYGPAEAYFAVLGLGKMGGCELGYGSDLDLVFVYEDNPRIESGMAAAEYFAAVASHVIRVLKEPTRYGTLYDVDARLRPDGKKGMLTISTSRIEEYYLREAHAWERLALAKARAVAGDMLFGGKLESLVRDLAFSLPLTQETLANIEEVRGKIAASATPMDLKKGEGGIAEIEFAVRLLQCRHAAEDPSLKRSDVAGAMDRLVGIGVLHADDGQTLLAAYRQFRLIENRIRMMHGRPGSTMPDAPEARADLAARLGIEEDLDGLVQRHKSAVHTIYMNVVSSLR